MYPIYSFGGQFSLAQINDTQVRFKVPFQYFLYICATASVIIYTGRFFTPVTDQTSVIPRHINNIMTYFDWGVVLGQDVILDLALYKFGIFIYLFIYSQSFGQMAINCSGLDENKGLQRSNPAQGSVHLI